jgi:DNA-binding transcriptional ArsR family regulator
MSAAVDPRAVPGARAPRRGEATDERLDGIFGALSDRTRRAMLARLREGPATVGELAAPFAMSLPAVSRHLKVLERERLVMRDVSGRVHRCSLGTAPLMEVLRWLDRYAAHGEGDSAAN